METNTKKGMENIMNNIQNSKRNVIDMEKLYEEYKGIEEQKEMLENKAIYKSSTIKVPSTYRTTSSIELAKIVKNNCINAKSLYEFVGNKAVNTAKSGFEKESVAGITKRTTVVYYDKSKNRSVDTALKNTRLANLFRSLRELNLYVNAPEHRDNQVYTFRMMLPQSYEYVNCVAFDADDACTSLTIPNWLLEQALLLKQNYICVSCSADNVRFIKAFMANLAKELDIPASELQFTVVTVDAEDNEATLALFDSKTSPKYQPLTKSTFKNINQLKGKNDKLTKAMIDKYITASVNRDKMKRIKEINLENKNK